MSIIMVGSSARFQAPSSYSAAAQGYISAVEAADGQQLETAVRDAYAAFIDGLISDGLLGTSGGVISQAASLIKASSIMAGARTLAGALVPLVGPAPTNNNFLSTDYSRKIGLKGNGSSKYLSINRNSSADPQNSSHLAIYKNDNVTDTNPYWIGAATAGGTLVNAVGRNAFYSNSGTPESTTTSVALGLHGVSRGSSSIVSRKRPGSAAANYSDSSTGVISLPAFVFNINIGGTPGATQWSSSSLAFYSQGENINLNTLAGRCDALIAAIAAAIP